jgi:hypothetical protein
MRGFTTRFSRRVLVVAAVVGMTAGASLATAALTTSSATSTIVACQLNGIGTIRIVTDASKCSTKLETPISWNTTGPAGPAGNTGAIGATGPTGPIGPTGADGMPCLASNPACIGPAGPAGTAGSDGTNGHDGAPGATGSTGPQGPQGPQGSQGPQGPAGPGSTIRWVSVNDDATLRSQSLNLGASYSHSGNLYIFDFADDVSQCALSATASNEYTATAFHAFFAFAAHRVIVEIFKGYDLFGAPAFQTSGFSLILYC